MPKTGRLDQLGSMGRLYSPKSIYLIGAILQSVSTCYQLNILVKILVERDGFLQIFVDFLELL